jgi:hypothetical protein
MLLGRIIVALAVLVLSAVPLKAQSQGGFVQGQTLTAAQLNAAAASKMDYPSGTPAAGYVPIATGATGAVWGNSITPAAGATAFKFLGTVDTSWSSFGTPEVIVATHGNQNSLVGFALNDLAPSTNALPVGVSGYSKVALGSNGNQGLGLYGLGELYATSGGVAIGGEVTCRNWSGNAPSTNLPPNEGIGTTQTVCNGLQVTAGGTNNSAIGISISSEGGSTEIFNTGIYLTPTSFAQYGLFIDSQTTGGTPTVASAVIQNNGAGINLQLGTTGTATASNTVLTVLNHLGASQFNIRQNGDTFANGWIYGIANESGVFPSANNGGAQGWNFSGGGAEVDLFNTYTASVNSFKWYQQTGTSAATLLATLGPGLQVGAAPTGGDKGAGSINFSGTLWTNGTQGIASRTCTVNQALTLIFTNGILTGGTCVS